MKKNFFLIIVVIIILGGIVGVYGRFSVGRDVLIEEFPDGLQDSVSVPTETVTPVPKAIPIELVAEEERSLEGTMMFSVNANGKVIGQFDYERTQEHRPLCQEFNGDYILGKNHLFITSSGKIERLNSIESEWIMDYSINENLLATVEKVRGKEHLFEIVIKDVNENKVEVIHKFRYGNYLYPLYVTLDWGQDGKLYYDSYNGEVPVINVYDPKTDSSKELFTAAYSPQTSKDGTKILYYQLDKDLDFRTGERILYDLVKKELITTIEGVYKTFWVDDFLITTDQGDVYVYLANNGKLVQEIEAAGDVIDVSILDGKLALKTYYTDNSVKGTFITKERTVSYDLHKKIG